MIWREEGRQLHLTASRALGWTGEDSSVLCLELPREKFWPRSPCIRRLRSGTDKLGLLGVRETGRFQKGVGDSRAGTLNSKRKRKSQIIYLIPLSARHILQSAWELWFLRNFRSIKNQTNELTFHTRKVLGVFQRSVLHSAPPTWPPKVRAQPIHFLQGDSRILDTCQLPGTVD